MATTRRGFLKLLGAAAVVPILPGVILEKPARNRTKIILVEDYIAGFQYYDGVKPEIAQAFRVSDILRLVREPQNRYDDQAIQIFTAAGDKLGYVPRAVNEIPARIADQGFTLEAEIVEIDLEAPTWEQVLVKVYLAV